MATAPGPDLFTPDDSDTLSAPFTSAAVESEEDLHPAKYSEAITWATDWTTETLIQQLRKSTILLDPSFQRRDAWTVPRKSRFIESLILGLPIPQIVLAERQDKKGRFIVLDGKQRLLSLLQFCSPKDELGSGFALKGLTILKQLNGKTFEDFNSDPSLDETLASFSAQIIRTVVIKNWPNEDFLYTVFYRLNSNNVPLSPQELRKALIPGPFVDFADASASNSKVLQKALGLQHPDFRMRDVEIVVRYYAFRNFIKDYRGELKRFLDDTCRKLNKAWETDTKKIKAQFDDFEKAISFTERIFGQQRAFRKFTDAGYETRLNRAVFDIFLYYFSQKAFVDGAKGRETDIRKAYESLCVEDVEFRQSLETSTKITEVVRKRFNTWGKTLSHLLKVKFEPPL